MKIVFYCNTTSDALKTVGFYRQNIEALNDIASELVICTRYRDIPKDFDVMFVYWWTYALFPVIKARLKNRAVIISGAYNFELPKYSGSVDYLSRPLYQRILIRLATKLATLNLVNSEYERKQIVDFFRIANCEVSYLSYSEELLESKSVIPSERIRKLKEAGQLDSFIFNICWLEESNLLRKGVFELLQAFSKTLQTDDRGQYLVCAGREGDGLKKFQSAVNDLDISKRVIHLGEITEEEKQYLLQSCMIYAQPSKYEGFGLATLEAAVSGAPVIAVDVGAVREVVRDCGLYVDGNDISDIARAILRIMNKHWRPEGGAIEDLRDTFSETNFRNRLKDYVLGVVK